MAAVFALWQTSTLIPLNIRIFFHEVSNATVAAMTDRNVVSLSISVDQGGLVMGRGGSRFITLSADYLGSLLPAARRAPKRLCRHVQLNAADRDRSGPGLWGACACLKACRSLATASPSQIYARDDVDIERATLAGWVGRSTALLEPLADAIGRIWAYVRDARPWAGQSPPYAW